MTQLGRMMQVSMIGYLVGGAFLSLSYWDMPYYVAVIVVAMRRLIQEHQAVTMPLASMTAIQRRLRNAAGPPAAAAPPVPSARSVPTTTTRGGRS
jgi:hypothetical protein